MAAPWTIILNAGGLRSLVATATAMAEPQRPRIALVHLVDLRRTAAVRLQHMRRQADHFQANRVIELEMPQVEPGLHQTDPDHPVSPLIRSQVLLSAIAQAVELDAARLIWPVQFDGELQQVAQVTEQTVLASHLAQIEVAGVGRSLPAVETPLLELKDRQVIELGSQLGVPWELAWSCQLDGATPCKACPACRRRRQAFDAAGLVDPVQRPAARVR